MEFQYYDYILTIAKHGSMSKAANELFVSQPTLSRAVSKLEESLGIELFQRIHNQLVLTPAGECYVKYTKEMLTLKKKMLKEFETLNPQREEKLVIGFPFSYSCNLLSYVMPAFYAIHPHTKVEIKEMPGDYLSENLINRTLDLAVIADTSFSSELHCEYLEDQRILLVVPRNNELYYESIDDDYRILDEEGIKILNSKPFIGYAPKEGMRKVCDDFFKSRQIAPNVILEVQDTSTAYSLAASGIGLTMVSELRYLLKPINISDSEYCAYQLGNPPFTRTRVVAYPKDIPISKAAEDFIKLAKSNIHHLNPSNVSSSMNSSEIK